MTDKKKEQSKPQTAPAEALALDDELLEDVAGGVVDRRRLLESQGTEGIHVAGGVGTPKR